MNPDVSKYFWILDHNISDYYINNYVEALKNKKNSQLNNIVNIIKERIPFLPQAYLTPSLVKILEDKMPNDFLDELSSLLSYMEEVTSCEFGGTENALLINIEGDFSGSVRNIGSCVKSFESMVDLYGYAMSLEIFVDFLESYSTSVLCSGGMSFREMFEIAYDRDLGIDKLKEIDRVTFEKYLQDFRKAVSEKTGKSFPEAPEKLLLSTLLFFANAKKENKNDEIFLKVVVPVSREGQYISGLTYTSDPFTGLKDMYGSLRLFIDEEIYGKEKAKEKLSVIYAFLEQYLVTIELIYKDIMGISFVIDKNNKVYFSYFYKPSKTSTAEVVNIIELNSKEIISDIEAVSRIKAEDVEILLHPILKENSRDNLVDLGYRGITASPGTVVGKIFFKMKDAIEYSETNTDQKYKAVLFANELLISDAQGLGIIGGLVTKASGIASHAAVMARANGIPCVVGYKDLEIDIESKCMYVGKRKIENGTIMTIEASNEGRLFLGEGELQIPSIEDGVLRDVVNLVDKVIKTGQLVLPLEIKANINSAKDAQISMAFGADGVGLCRTENMLTEPDSLKELRKIIFSNDEEIHKQSLKKLEETQTKDFRDIFYAIKNKPINIRLMDMPLDDFSPKTDTDFEKLQAELPMVDKSLLQKRAKELKEHNPMLGLRACRWGILNPEIYNIQIRAIILAAYEVAKTGIQVDPGIMFPLVFSKEELIIMSKMVLEIEDDICTKNNISYKDKIHIRIGCMVELPSATLSTDKLAEIAEFFAFGTNDLTQTTLGISRDDSGAFLPYYLDKNIVPCDPFSSLDPCVQELIEIAVKRGRRTRNDAVFGICGEQGGDPSTLLFCLKNEINYLSCSSYRILPIKVALLKMLLSKK